MLLLGSAIATPYKSGEIKTWETFNYGKFVTKMKTSEAKGTVASFFLFWDGPNWAYE